MKKCSKCEKDKPLEAFHRNNRASDGRASQCKACRNETARSLPVTKEKRARQREANERWRNRNPERAKELYRASYARHRSKNQEAARRRYAANPQRHRQAVRRWKDANRERYLAGLRELRRKNAERHRAAVQAWFRKNPARAREYAHRRRVLLGTTDPATLARMAELLAQPCTYCGATENITIDHIVPLSRGGKHEAANLTPACLPCNCSKRDRLPSEWGGRVV